MEQTIMLYSLNLDWQVQAEKTDETVNAAAVEKSAGGADEGTNAEIARDVYEGTNAVTTEETAAKSSIEITEKDLQTELYALMPELKENVNRLIGDVIGKMDITGFQNESHTAILSVEWEPSVEIAGSGQVSQVISETAESFLKKQLAERFECAFQIEAAELGTFTRREQQDDASLSDPANADYDRGRYDAEIENMLEKVMEQNKDLERMIIRNQEKSKKNGFVKYLLVINIVESSILFGLLMFVFVRLFMLLG